MERRKKGSGQITYVDEPTRKAKWKATIMDGAGRRKTRYFKTQKEAKAFLRELNADANKLKALSESGVTFSAFVPVFLEERKKANMKPRSYETLESSIARVEPLIGRTMLRDIDNDTVQQVIYTLAKSGYSNSILNKSKNVIGSILKMAAAKHFLDSVPVLNITIPAQPNQDADKLAKNNWLKENELAEYEAECKRTYIPQKYTKNAGQELPVHPAGYKLLFLLHTGLRIGEALALTWDDYSEMSKTITVDKNVVSTKAGKITQTPKTASGERVLVLNRRAVMDLEMLRKQFDEQTAMIEEREAEALLQAEAVYTGPALKAAKNELVKQFAAVRREHRYICSSSSYPFGSSNARSTNQTHNKICKAIGLSHSVTVHGLRHTYVTHYYLKHKNDADFDLATFSKSIGHSSIRTTMEIYAHLDMTENRYIQRTIEDLKDF
ncbi:MAG: site-specific integrase [Ruminococcus flavefaciens]|nr:site-specific integrase [Ruminococcus flavefaciens]